MRFLVALLALLTACTATAVDESRVADPGFVAVAEEICPIMWRWQLEVGQTMNEMSSATRGELDATNRRSMYARAFTEARELTAGLRGQLRGLTSGPFADLLAQDILDGLAHAERIIGDLETETDMAGAYTEVVPVIFIGFEKVIDVAKPEMASYGNDDLVAAFMTVPQCQHGVKDANDGVPRYIPLDD